MGKKLAIIAKAAKYENAAIKIDQVETDFNNKGRTFCSIALLF